MLEEFRSVARAFLAETRPEEEAPAPVEVDEAVPGPPEEAAGVTAANEEETREFLLNFQPLPLTAEIAERAVAIRRASKIKLPDAIIQATAEVERRVLITRNTRDFTMGTAGIDVPYTL